MLSFGVGYILLFFLGLYLATIGWITAWQFLLYLLIIPIFVITIIGLPIYVFLQIKKNKEEQLDIFKQSKKLDATTVLDWTRDYMKKKHHENVELTWKEDMTIGKKDSLTPIIYLIGISTKTMKKYHILVNLLDPEGRNTIVYGDFSSEELTKMAEKLSYDPPKRTKEIIKVINTDGTIREIERDIEQPDQIVVKENGGGL